MVYNVCSDVYMYIFTWWIGPNISVKNKYNNINRLNVYKDMEGVMLTALGNGQQDRLPVGGSS